MIECSSLCNEYKEGKNMVKIFRLEDDTHRRVSQKREKILHTPVSLCTDPFHYTSIKIPSLVRSNVYLFISAN